MKQSVALPVKVPEPVLHLHFVSRSDCWSHAKARDIYRSSAKKSPTVRPLDLNFFGVAKECL